MISVYGKLAGNPDVEATVIDVTLELMPLERVVLAAVLE
jgi:hypothetical protein